MKTMVKNLKLLRITAASLNNGWVSVHINGKRIPRQKLKVFSHLYRVGNWSRSKSRIHVDNDIPSRSRRWLKFLAIHEAVEKFVSKKYSLCYTDAHQIATRLEHRYIEEHYGIQEISRYENFVSSVHRKELAHRICKQN